MLRRVFVAVILVLVTIVASPITRAQQLLNGADRTANEVRPASLNRPAAVSDWIYEYDHSSDRMSFQEVDLLSHEAPRGEFYAGVELVIVKPYWEDEIDTLTEIQDQGTPFENESLVGVDPDYSCSVSPRVYVGYRNADGFGGRVRYWVYDDSSETLVTEDPFSDRNHVLNADLNVQALDLEATKFVSDGLFSLEFGGGARYGRTEVEASFEIPSLLASWNGRATFEGVGPTIFTEARHRLGSSNFAVVGNLRGSLLYGQSRTSVDAVGVNSSTQWVNKGESDIVPVIEAQMGAEYARRVGHGRLALRALMEGQWWGTATPGASFSRDLQNSGNLTVDQFSSGRDLGFFGVTAAIIYER